MILLVTATKVSIIIHSIDKLIQHNESISHHSFSFPSSLSIFIAKTQKNFTELMGRYFAIPVCAYDLENMLELVGHFHGCKR